MHLNFRTLLIAAALSCPTLSFAQSQQPYALQLSVFTTGILVEDGVLGGYGVEPQFRFNRVSESGAGVLSIGIGAQYTVHKSADNYTLKVKGAFIEPRLVLPRNTTRVFPYLAARIAVLQQSGDIASSTNGYALGAGGGIVMKMNKNVNLDIGVAALYQYFADAKTASGDTFAFGGLPSYAAKIGFNIGFP